MENNKLELEKLRIEEDKQKRKEAREEDKRFGKIIIGLIIASFSILGLLAGKGEISYNWYKFIAKRLLEDCQECCMNNDFEGAHVACKKLYAYCEHHNDSYGDLWYMYNSAEEELFTAESQYLIAHIDDKTSADKICFMLTSLPVRGVFYPNGTHLEHSDVVYGAKEYAEWVINYNVKCNKLLSLAIGIENKTLAKRILALFKEDYIFEETGICEYVVRVSNSTKNDAKKRFEEAFGK